MRSKKSRLLTLFAAFVLACSTHVQAQGGPGDPGDPGGDPGGTTDIPLDGGVSLLVAAAVGFGIKKVYDRKKEEQQA